MNLKYSQNRITSLKFRLNCAKRKIQDLRACRSDLTREKFACVCIDCGNFFHKMEMFENHECFTKQFSTVIIKCDE